jgi:hypothetical protein
MKIAFQPERLFLEPGRIGAALAGSPSLLLPPERDH